MLCGPHPFGLKTSMSFVTSQLVPLKFRPKKSRTLSGMKQPSGGNRTQAGAQVHVFPEFLSAETQLCLEKVAGARAQHGPSTAPWHAGPAGAGGPVRTHTAAGGRGKAGPVGSFSRAAPGVSPCSELTPNSGVQNRPGQPSSFQGLPGRKPTQPSGASQSAADTGSRRGRTRSDGYPSGAHWSWNFRRHIHKRISTASNLLSIFGALTN